MTPRDRDPSKIRVPFAIRNRLPVPSGRLGWDLRTPETWITINPLYRLPLAPTMDLAHTVYAGRTRKLVVALDIGTTFSGAAYAFLDPGEIPQIRSVTK